MLETMPLEEAARHFKLGSVRTLKRRLAETGLAEGERTKDFHVTPAGMTALAKLLKRRAPRSVVSASKSPAIQGTRQNKLHPVRPAAITGSVPEVPRMPATDPVPMRTPEPLPEPQTPMTPAIEGWGTPATPDPVLLDTVSALEHRCNTQQEEITRLTEYTEGADILLGEMVKTLTALEDRLQSIESGRPARPIATRQRITMPRFVTGLLQTASALLNFRPALAPLPTAHEEWAPQPEVYYANTLTRARAEGQ